MMKPEFRGRWVNDAGNLLIIWTTRRGRYRAHFVRNDGRLSLWRRFLTRLLENPAFGLYGTVRDGALEIEIGPSTFGRALRLTILRDEGGDLLTPEIVPSIVDLDDWWRWQAPRVSWLEPLSHFRRAERDMRPQRTETDRRPPSAGQGSNARETGTPAPPGSRNVE